MSWIEGQLAHLAFDEAMAKKRLEERVLEVAERIDANPEEIEQDIRDAIKAVREEGNCK